MNDLEKRVEDLEQQLRDLSRAPDNASDTFTIVNADGSTGAFFPGGLQMPEATAFHIPQQPEESVSWVDPNGVVRSQIYGVDEGGSLHAIALRFPALGAFGGPVLFDTDKKSSFLQLIGRTVADRQIAFGQQTLTWPGGARQSSTLSFNHGLGSGPALVLANPHGQTSDGNFWSVDYSDANATQISIAGEAPFASPAAGATAPVWWAAIV